jgi:hypothetical protein
MNGVKQPLKRIIPAPAWSVGSDAYWWWRNRGRHSWARLTDPEWRKNLKRVRAYQDIHKTERCFIIGNGPSLNQMDLTRLRGQATFGLNRIYLLFPELGFTTTYLVSVNDLVLEQCAPEMRQLKIPKFITWRTRGWFHGDPHANFIDTDFTGPENFSGDALGRVFEGFTVTFVALQLAFYMGFHEVVLIGVDHNFTTQGTPNATVVSSGDDPNHFAPGYFGKGFRWQLPDLEGSERAYRLARKAYAEVGRRIVDATQGGKLTIFPKVDYNTLFNE